MKSAELAARMLSGLLLTLGLVEIALPVLLFLMRDRMVFLPSVRPTPEEGLSFLRGRADVDLVRVRRSDGRVLAGYYARPHGNDDPGAPVVLFLHGNGGNIAGRASLLEDFVAGTGLRTLLLDYSGYGGNAGTPSETESAVAWNPEATRCWRQRTRSSTTTCRRTVS